MGGGDDGIHEGDMPEPDALLEEDEAGGVFYTKHPAEQFAPEGYRVALFLAFAGPCLSEAPGGLLVVLHVEGRG